MAAGKGRRLLLLRGDSEGVVSIWVVPEAQPSTPPPQRPPGIRVAIWNGERVIALMKIGLKSSNDHQTI